MIKEITKESIAEFLNGRDPMERIVNIECGYNDDMVSVIYRDENGVKRIKKEEFRPFVWCKNKIAVRMFQKEGRSIQEAREMLRNSMARNNIGCKALEIYSNDGKTHERLENGYRLMFYAKRRMSYQKFLQFFQYAGTPVYVKYVSKKMEKEGFDGREFLAVSPVEQYMIYTGRRLFKGYEGYDDMLRMFFDLETEGLNPKKHRISQIGIRTNKGFAKVIPVTGDGEERRINEINAIDEFYKTIGDIKPDVLAGHNSFNFDHPFIETRCEEDGVSNMEISQKYLRGGMYTAKKDAILKLGGEVETYRPTKCFGISIVDSMHAARRAQAQNSDIKSANLKYLTDYIKEKKPNRVYVPGDKIQKTWDDTEEHYAFNDNNGDWYIYDPNAKTNAETEEPKPGVFKIRTRNQLLEGYELKSGRYIVERYLLDDVYETDKVELKFNESNFLTNKILPTTFERACTMGTAGIWKLIVLAFMFENGLAIPRFIPKRRFVGGISRLLRVGYISNVYKLDYNSLYPSIMLTWKIAADADVHGVLLPMLEYVLTTREKYKDLKAQAGKRADELKEQIEKLREEGGNGSEIERLVQELNKAKADKVRYDRLQQPFKVLGNSVFGSVSNPELFPFGDVDAGEMTTCTGRQALRLMIGHFSNLGYKFNKPDGTEYGDDYCYKPIVGDSFTGDTPIFIKQKKNGMIDIVPISSIVSYKKLQKDALGREYDYSNKPFYVLCRSGWVEPSYIYRHKTKKDIYNVNDDKSSIDVTQDHSLYNSNKEEIKPSNINSNTQLEYYGGSGECEHICKLSKQTVELYANHIIDSSTGVKLPASIINCDIESAKYFLHLVETSGIDITTRSKSIQAGILFLKNRVLSTKK